MFKLNISLGILWNLFVTTVDGPPDKIMPFTFLNISFLFKSLGVKISEKTF